MKKKILIGSILAVVLLTLVSFSSVVAKISSDEELVELEVEFSGLGKKHTVKLTQQEANEVDLLFDDLEQRLSKVENRNEAEEIFKDAVVELDKFGLLGGLSIRQAQQLVTRKYKHLPDVNTKLQDDNSNILCLVAGKTVDVLFISPLFQIILFFIILRDQPVWFHWVLFPALIDLIRPVIWLSFIAFAPSSYGWLFSLGLKGIKYYNGNITGLVTCFTGIKVWLLNDNSSIGTSYLLGTAFKIDVDVT